MNKNESYMLQSHFDWQHGQRVADLAFRIAQKAGHTQKSSEMIADAAFYHDIGKIFLPEHILFKPGPLNKYEYQLVQTHVLYGHQLIKALQLLHFECIAETALLHHERIDGSGYFGKSGKDLSPVICITAIADVFDAMTSRRPYKEAQSVQETLKYLQKNASILFEEKYVDALSACCNKK